MMLQIRPDGVAHFTPLRVAHNVPESLAHFVPVEVVHYAPVCSITVKGVKIIIVYFRESGKMPKQPYHKTQYYSLM